MDNQEFLNAQEVQFNELDVKMVNLNLHSFYEFYSIIINQTKLIAKVFSNDLSINFVREKQVLERLNHQRIIKPLNSNLSLVAKLADRFRRDTLVLPEAPRGDLFTFIKKLGGVSQKVGGFYLRQIIDSLIYCQHQNSLHPNLNLENILLTDDKNILLCGWSNSSKNKYNDVQDYFFKLGEIILNLIISRSPFTCSDFRIDPYGKFLQKEQTISKFWQQLERTVRHVKFSKQLRELIFDLFFKKITTFQQILARQFFKNQIKTEQIAEQLQQRKSEYIKKTQNRTSLVNKKRIEEKSLLDTNGNITFELKNKRSDEYFVEQYQNYQEKIVEIPVKQKSDQAIYFKLFDSSPKILISHLKARLKQVQVNEQQFADPLFLLNNFDVTLRQNMIDVICFIGWNHKLFIEKMDPQCGFNFTISISLLKDGDSLIGKISSSECRELSSDCVHNVNLWIREMLQSYG